MICYRIALRKYADMPLSGEGARLYGGRWNSRGTEVVYAASTLELAMLEMLVHWSHFSLIPEMIWFRFELFGVESTYFPKHLPSGWKDPVRYHQETQKVGDVFITKGADLYIEVPSVVVPTGRNILINPNHELVEKINVEAHSLDLDPRLHRATYIN